MGYNFGQRGLYGNCAARGTLRYGRMRRIKGGTGVKKLKSLAGLFLVMFKIGLFTFGGGYAMISLLQHEFVEKRKWLESGEFLDLVTIAESTPGPVAVNCATYIGYKTGKVAGAAVGTLGVCLPSFAVIFVISLFFDAFLANKYVAAAFRGIQICVLFLMLAAGVKMFKKVKKTVLGIIIFSATFAAMVLTGLFAVNFSSIFYILISGAVGLAAYAVVFFKDKRKKSEKRDGGEE